MPQSIKISNNKIDMEIICPICKTEMKIFAKNRDIQNESNKNIYSAFECKACVILFQYPFWKPEETYRFYETDYYAHTETPKIPRSLVLLDFFMKADFFCKLFSPLRKKIFPFFPGLMKSQTILDIGCGKGLFLDKMKKYNKKTFGLEPSDQAKAISTAKGHQMIDKDAFYSFSNHLKFDLITMFQVAEHLSVKELFEEDIFSKIFDSLEFGGQLVIETPTYDCAYAKEYKSDWRAMELPRHLVIFSPQSLSKMLKEKGFKTKVYTRISPIDVIASLKLKYKENTIKNKILMTWEILKISLSPNKNSSLLTVIAQK